MLFMNRVINNYWESDIAESFDKSSSKAILRFSSSIKCETDSCIGVNSGLGIEFNKGTEDDSG